MKRTNSPSKSITTLSTTDLQAVRGGNTTSVYNKQETLSSNVQKQRDDVNAGTAGKIG